MTCPHIVLVGFMGVGKSTVGKILSRKTGFPLIDIDEEIQKKYLKPIQQIFAEDGQEIFRQKENEILQSSLVQESTCIIVLGAGGLENKENRICIRENALSFWLDASFDTIEMRLTLEEKRKRPLLALHPSKNAQKILFTQRLPQYAKSRYQIAAQNSPQEIAEEIIQKIEAFDKTIWIKSNRRSYPCILRACDADWLAPYLSTRISSKHVLLLSDQRVGEQHGDTLLQELENAGFDVTKVYVSNTEQAKSLEQAAKLYEICLKNNFNRDSAIIGLGGGMIGDLAGFLAATYMRGIPLYLIPTTTLAAVDAAVGAKNALNFAGTKNVIGSYYPPQEVLISSALLRTQNPQEHYWGFVEALKMSVTSDYKCLSFFSSQIEAIKEMTPKIFMHAIARAIALKKSLVEDDEYDAGNRMILNFGHTVGHALESGQNFAIAHGKAVGLGMLAESNFSEHMGWSSGINEELEPLLRKLAIETQWREHPIDMLALKHDKKCRADRITLPVIKRLGDCEIMNVELYELENFLNAH